MYIVNFQNYLVESFQQTTSTQNLILQVTTTDINY